MIAVAVIPPAATVGIGLAWGEPAVAIGSSVLLLVNVLSINFAALAILWYMGYRTREGWKFEQTRENVVKRLGAFALAILLLSAFLGAVTFSSYQTATTEQSIRDEVEGVFQEPEYLEFVLLEIQYEYSQNLLFERPAHVTLIIGSPTGDVPQELGVQLNSRIDDAAGRDVSLQVRYVGLHEPA